MESRYRTLERAQLATLVPELLLAGQLIDRSAMAWCISALGRDEMAAIAIEEWMAASPIYTRRMQRALGYEGDDVITIFKGLQLDIGAPPQFMDFRYTVHDRRHGEFHLDHCGALMDVEPLGEDYVRAMCHDIEDPTFDATAVATNPRAQVRPIHRPPRTPPDRQPHCAWTVVIDESHPPVSESTGCTRLRRSKAATLELAPIDPGDEGMADYSGPLLADLDFGAFSRSALARMADEVCLQMHLLHLGFRDAVRDRVDAEQSSTLCTKQLVGIAGIAAERIHTALGLPGGIEGALRTLELHPLLNPAAYVDAEVSGDMVRLRRSPAHADGSWITLCGPGHIAALQAIVRAVDPHLDVRVEGEAADWSARVHRRDEPAKEFDEVAVTRVSTGAAFVFQPRRSLPITPVTSMTRTGGQRP
ncbi:hypothetical protein SacmaDRAFT_5571 [Saccharomonospora marina XMU15]|uniref:Uncharacterized protein n=1 Tax=Saccharomonospora marina XMU15 TaxID=882083 RepID=H5XA27_9PSEU|nr:hypothetical protein [Saccharomonospora marina]EHR53687.1 hypothetical protein SacmaDRAFT_5571 [Saccharomonospora marina XMU15]